MALQITIPNRRTPTIYCSEESNMMRDGGGRGIFGLFGKVLESIDHAGQPNFPADN